jgi:hypothetical protein
MGAEPFRIYKKGPFLTELSFFIGFGRRCFGIE